MASTSKRAVANRRRANGHRAPNVFRVFGPFKLHYLKGTSLLDPEQTEHAIRRQLKQAYPDDNLETKGGCYVFAVRTGGKRAKGGSYKPWYVGKAFRNSLLDESLHAEKYKKCYFRVAATEHGTPVLFWIAKALPGHKSALDKREIGDMERELIKLAAIRNPRLMNKHHNKPSTFQIIGVPLGAQCHPRARGQRGAAAWLSAMLRSD